MNEIMNKFDNIKWMAAFEVTRYCNMACDICGVSSGPHAPFRFLESARICNILTAARNTPEFSHQFVLSGGEVTTAYAYNRNYLNELLKAGRDLKMRCTIRTNGKISNKNLVSLCNDLMPFATMGKKAANALRIGLSLDASHKNSFDYNLRLVNVLTRDLGLPSKVFFIVSVGDVQTELARFADKLQMPVLRRQTDGIIYKIGNIAIQNTGNVYNAGRAMENNIGNVPTYDLATALSKIQSHGMIWFSVNNTASFIYNFNTLLSTSLRDAGGADKSLTQIMSELRAQCAERLGVQVACKTK